MSNKIVLNGYLNCRKDGKGFFLPLQVLNGKNSSGSIFFEIVSSKINLSKFINKKCSIDGFASASAYKKNDGSIGTKFVVIVNDIKEVETFKGLENYIEFTDTKLVNVKDFKSHSGKEFHTAAIPLYGENYKDKTINGYHYFNLLLPKELEIFDRTNLKCIFSGKLKHEKIIVDGKETGTSKDKTEMYLYAKTTSEGKEPENKEQENKQPKNKPQKKKKEKNEIEDIGI